MKRTVAIGIQDFSTLIEKHCFYVDKTAFIKEWWENQDAVTLITRPRRFGKTLTMSMVEQFFSVKYADKKRNFEGLNIFESEEYRDIQGTYPVLSLSLANVKETTYEKTRRQVCQMITGIYNEHAFLLESGILTDQEQAYFRKINEDMDEVVASYAIHELSRFLYRYYNKKVIILLYEYDTPMQ